MNDKLPLHLKFGYDHMLEMAAIRAELVAKGVTGTALHFKAIAIYEAKHAGDPTFAERCAARWGNMESAPNPFVEALRQIRDGHNDPRGLAREILEITGRAVA